MSGIVREPRVARRPGEALVRRRHRLGYGARRDRIRHPAGTAPCPDVSDRGSGTVWTLACMAMTWLMAVTVMMAGGARAARHRAHAAADLAALAAASHAGAGQGPACRRAAAVAAGSGGRLSGCVVTGRIADVTVVMAVRVPAVSTAALRTTARARAGPADPGVTWTPHARCTDCQ